MNGTVEDLQTEVRSGQHQAPSENAEVSAAEDKTGVEAELARYLPYLKRMSVQLKQTTAQIEVAVVEVCNSFQGIAQRARQTVARTTGFLGKESEQRSSKRSFEGLLASCGDTLVKILTTTEEAGELSQRAIDRIQQMDNASVKISDALVKLEQIARENKMLAINARIEAAHAGEKGVGFEVVAVEVVSQTEKSRLVTAQVSGLIENLRALAGSTLEDLRRMNDQGHKRVAQCRQEVEEELRDLRAAHGEMREMLAGMTEEGALLANDIGASVRGLQFQDRTSQRISHVIDDLDTLHALLIKRFGSASSLELASDEGFSAYTMQEEREVAGMSGTESSGGEIELF